MKSKCKFPAKLSDFNDSRIATLVKLLPNLQGMPSKPPAKKSVKRKLKKASPVVIGKFTKQKSKQTTSSLENTVEAAGMGFWEWTVKTNAITWSKQVYKLFDVNTKSFSRTVESFLNLIYPADRPCVEATIQKAITTGKNYQINHRITLKDGSIRWIEGVGHIIKSKRGAIQKIAGFVRDVTSEKIIEHDRENWKNRFELIAKSAGVVLYEYSTTGEIVWSGETFETLGYMQKDMGNITAWESRIHPDDRADAIKKLDNAMQTASRYDVSYRFKHKSGKYIHLHDRGFFNAGDDGKAITMLGMMNDISDRLEAEGKFQKLIRDLSIGVRVHDMQGQVLVSNQKAEELLDYHPKGLEGLAKENRLIKEDQTFFTPEELPVYTVIKTKKKKRDVVAGIIGKNDSVKWVMLHAEPLTDASGKMIQIVTTFTDITENKKFQSALIESENRFRTLQEASFGGIGMHDKGIIIDCNQGLCELTGYTQAELIGMNGLSLIAEEYRSFVLERIVSGYDKPYDTEGVKKDGSRYFLEIRGKNIPYLGKQIRVTEFRDITERKKTEQKISEQNAKLIAVAEDLKIKNEQLQEFTQIVSHNLRSPVGNILTLSDFIEQSKEQKEKDEYHSLIKVSAEKIQNTLTELHEVLRIKQDTNIEKQHLHFDEILTATKFLLHTQLVQSETQIFANFSSCPNILYPKVYLDSIFLNLISNAIKYGKPNTPPVIRIKTEMKDGVCLLTCSDNGLGIDLNKHRQSLFKLHKTFHDHPESRGIGLFMIKNQIEAMGGTITVESEVNKGTTFIVNFGN